jgi:LysM repeat protein
MGEGSPAQSRTLQAAAVVVFAAFAAGCAAETATDTAPIDTVAAPSSIATQQAPKHIVVRAGQSVSRIAAEYGVPRRAIIAANHLEPPYKLKIGQQLVIPRDEAPLMAATAVESKDIPRDHAAGTTGASVSAISQPPTSPIPAARIAAATPSQPQEQGTAGQAGVTSNFKPSAVSGAATPSAPASNEAAAASPRVAAAAPPGVTCPPGMTGAWTVDVIQIPMYICR